MTRAPRVPPSQTAPDRREHAPGPIGGQLANILDGLLVRFRFASMVKRHDARWMLAIFSFINGCLSIAIMATAALVSGQPFIFPSLGPTAFLFFYAPLTPPASPRNAFIGHLIGAAAGYISLAAFGLLHEGPALTTGVTSGRVGAAALSLGLTSALMVLARAPHPPAGATTLIISLGILRDLDQIAILMVAVVLLTIQAIVINRLAGLPYPLWETPPEPKAVDDG
ncbi:MAG: HPP family protein [Thermomicrobiales bacterium]|nr:HPP family protein [Thermomicrobiales bacterium]